jgi:molecular chaperone DnaK
VIKESTSFTDKEVEVVNKNELVVGIDLGTTNTAMAIVRAGDSPSIIRLSSGKVTMPSCIYWKGVPGEYIIGDEAYRNRYKPSACYSVKRLMGTDSKVTLRYARKRVTLTPVEISAEFLKAVIAQGSDEYKGIKKVVVTVPARFNNLQVEDTIKAVELAGLELINITREPNAAAVAYGMEQDTSEVDPVIVYDLGGGTFDTSALRISKESTDDNLGSLYGDEEPSSDNSQASTIFSVITTEGDTMLGGDDIDLELYKLDWLPKVLLWIRFLKKIRKISFCS